MAAHGKHVSHLPRVQNVPVSAAVQMPSKMPEPTCATTREERFLALRMSLVLFAGWHFSSGGFIFNGHSVLCQHDIFFFRVKLEMCMFYSERREED